MPIRCSAQDCFGDVIARGLCEKHYRRLLHHGHLEQTRADDWGSREKHPLMWSWRTIVRKVGVTEEWKDFWKFVSDVGERPSKDHFLFRLDTSIVYGKSNFYWRHRICKKKIGETKKEAQRRYAKTYRSLYPEREQDRDLRRYYGISLEQYNEMLEKQSGVCAICGQPETVKTRNGKIRNLAVDHCHKNGQIRALLCGACNAGLGNFKDSVELLKKAIQFLET